MKRQSTTQHNNSYMGGDTITALYCRLSCDDGDNQGDSNSIKNQKAILGKYATEHGYGNVQFYVDDGYSGTNFNRPDFQRMIKDIDAGKVTTVIVKDMSRLGRDYLKVGYYSEVYFGEAGVHFIAINDGGTTFPRMTATSHPFAISSTSGMQRIRVRKSELCSKPKAIRVSIFAPVPRMAT